MGTTLSTVNPVDFLNLSLAATQDQATASAKNLGSAKIRGALRNDVVLTSTNSGVVSNNPSVFLNPDTVKHLQEANGDQAYWQIMQNVYTTFMENFGLKDNIESIDAMCQSICNQVLKLNTDISSNQKGKVLSELNTQLTHFTHIQKSISDARLDLSLQKANLVNTTIPNLLNQAALLNKDNRTADETQQLNLIQFDLAQHMGILTFEQGKGPESAFFTVKVGDVKLLEKQSVFPMSYVSTANPMPGVPLNPTIFNLTNQPIDTNISTGTLGAINMADSQLLAMQKALDNFAIHFRDTVNQLHNQGTGTSAPSSLQGTVGYFGTEGTPTNVNDVISGTGTLRIALLDKSQNNLVVDYVDVALQQGESIASLFNRINTTPYALNSGQTFSISVNASGIPQIVCSPGNTNQNLGISIGHSGSALAMMSSGNNFNAAAATNFSHFFHLNDLISCNTTSVDGVFGNLQVRADLPSNVNRLSGCDLAYDVPLTATSYGVVDRPPPDRNIFDQIYQCFTQSQLFTAAGDMGSMQTSIMNYGALIVDYYASKKISTDTSVQTATLQLQNYQLTFNKESGIDPEQEKLTSLQIARSMEATMSLMKTLMRLEQDALKLLEV